MNYVFVEPSHYDSYFKGFTRNHDKSAYDVYMEDILRVIQPSSRGFSIIFDLFNSILIIIKGMTFKCNRSIKNLLTVAKSVFDFYQSYVLMN